MENKQDIGKWGENVATKYVIKKGYKIIERNFSCKQGEIDIIARDKDEIVFIEVKTRTSKMYGEPIDAVNQIKQKHIYKSAKYYVYIHNLENEFIRFDIIEVYIKNKVVEINHILQTIQ